MTKQQVFGLALTWDGARWPTRGLSPKARAFLKRNLQARTVTAPSGMSVSELLENDQVRELRICWVPRLKGGDDVLSDPFLTARGLRLSFEAVRSRTFNDVLAVVYRRRKTAYT